MSDTLLLDRSTGDLCIDVSGNIAVAQEPYALSQDVASACRAVQGECWFDTNKGVPWFTQILGKRPPVSLIKQRLSSAALTVPDVASATVYLSSAGPRALTGQIQFTTSGGASGIAGL